MVVNFAGVNVLPVGPISITKLKSLNAELRREAEAASASWY